MTTASTDFGLAEIGQIAVRVRDLERAVGFYREKLGMQFLFHVPSMAFLQCGSVTLMLSLPETPEFDHPSSIIYFKVPDIELAHRVLVERGVHFRSPPHRVHRAADQELWLAFFFDADQNTLALMTWRRAA